LITFYFILSAGLSTGEVSGIVIAILFLLTIILALIAYVMWLKRQGKTFTILTSSERKSNFSRDVLAIKTSLAVH